MIAWREARQPHNSGDFASRQEFQNELRRPAACRAQQFRLPCLGVKPRRCTIPVTLPTVRSSKTSSAGLQPAERNNFGYLAQTRGLSVAQIRLLCPLEEASQRALNASKLPCCTNPGTLPSVEASQRALKPSQPPRCTIPETLPPVRRSKTSSVGPQPAERNNSGYFASHPCSCGGPGRPVDLRHLCLKPMFSRQSKRSRANRLHRLLAPKRGSGKP